MRKTIFCPKCGANEILFLPRLTDSNFDELAVFTEGAFMKRLFGRIEAHICRGCGYTELYTSDPEKIPVDRIVGARVLRGSDKNAYR